MSQFYIFLYFTSEIISNFTLLYAILILWEEPRMVKTQFTQLLFPDIYLAFENVSTNEADSTEWKLKSTSPKKKKKIDARRLSKSGELMQRNQTAICRWLSISCTIKTR